LGEYICIRDDKFYISNERFVSAIIDLCQQWKICISKNKVVSAIIDLCHRFLSAMKDLYQQ
jgi:hypothetical protein